MSKKCILLIVLLIVVIGACYGWLYYIDNNKLVLNDKEINNVEDSELMKNIPSVKLKKYENTTLGFSFDYSTDWHVGADNLDKGTLQLFNFDEKLNSGSVFKVGQNKIEIVVIKTNVTDSSDIYINNNQIESIVNVAGVDAKRIVVELSGGEKMVTYYIPLLKSQGNFLSMTIYGDVNNFNAVDDIANSFIQ